MGNKVIFMTGATSGLGKVAAFKLVNEGAKLIAAYRTKEKADRVLEEFNSLYPKSAGSFDFIECNLSSFKSVKAACDKIKETHNQIDQLLLNAGIWHFKPTKSLDGIEDTFQVNILMPHFIIDELLPLLEKSDDAKIIITSSGLHQGKINFKDIEFESNFKGMSAYRQSKLGVILLTRLLHTRIDNSIGIYCQQPGVVNTQLGRHAGWLSRTIFKLIGTTAEKGARTLLFLSRTPKSELKSGEYYTKSKLTKTTPDSYDINAANQLLEVSLEYRKKIIN